MTATLVISEHDQLGGLTDDDHAQYLLLAGRAGGQTAIGGTLTTQTLTLQDNAVDARQITFGPGITNGLFNAQTGGHDATWRHLGLGASRPATDTHFIIGAETHTTAGLTIVGAGFFPDYRPSSSGASTLVPVQGNAWFATTNWGVGSSIRCLDFFPAPQFAAGGPFGSANLNITGVATSGMLNIIGQTITASTIQGIAVSPIANIFGGTDNTSASIVRAIQVSAASATTGTWGRLTGIDVEPQTSGVVNHGIWLRGDGLGSDLSLGAGLTVNPDARIYYDGTNLIVDPNVTGSGSVYIGATGNDALRLTTLEFGADVSLTRGTANRLDLASGDTLRLVTGPLQFAGSAEQISRTSGELLLTATNVRVSAKLEIDGSFDHDGSTAGFYGTTPITKPTVTGAKGGNVALTNLLTALANLGLLTDSTT